MATFDADGPHESGAPPLPETPPAPLVGAAERPARSRRVRLRLALPVLAVAALLAVGLGALNWPGSGPNIAPVTVGPDGIPNQIDGQRVYRTQDLVDWLNLSDSFLLGAPVAAFPCWGGEVVSTGPVGPAEQASLDLYWQCGGALLGGTSGPEVMVAPRGSGVLAPWNDELAVVRVHTHDPEAAECDASIRDSCKSAIVVEQVVWPTVPSEVDGQHVYRAADSAQFDKLKGSFLLGGVVVDSPFGGPSTLLTEPSDQSCEVPAKPTADQLLLPDQAYLPGCPAVSIDGEEIAPASKIEPTANQIAVVRAHVNDALAAGCSTDVRSDCERAIVVEQAVWSYDPYAAPYAIPEVTASPVGPVGADGIPTTIEGQRVYRSDSLPTDASFLLGGQLTQNGSCPSSQPAATSGGGAAPACSAWKVGGVAVRTVIEIPPDVVGRLVVVDVARSQVFDCAETSSCSPQPVLVVTAISWSGP